MTFEANDPSAGIDGMPREIFTGDHLRDAAPSLGVAAGDAS
jgi:hypothetical protein